MTHSDSSRRSVSVLIRALRQDDHVHRICGQEPARQAPVAQLTDDSRRAGPRSLFVAVSGERHDGHGFIGAAIENGAAVVVCEVMPPSDERSPDVTYVQVRESRRALLTLTHEFYGAVAERLTMIGITGTNGKTTTAHVTHHLLQNLGIRSGMVGTLGAYVDGERRSLELTTPPVMDLYELWRDMDEAGCTACVMEISSHALAQERIDPARLDVGVFTNLSHDHLDYHGDIDSYARAKKRLFDDLTEDAVAVYNADDPMGHSMVQDTRADRLSYSIEAPADLQAQVLEESLTGLRFVLDEQTIESRLTGRFNVYNLLAAVGAARAAHADSLKGMTAALAAVPPVPGRLERLDFDNAATVFVDYAHTPDALEKTLETLRSLKSSAALLWCVFGCGGDRDAQKRPLMGRVAERLAERVIVTSDNPRTEDPEAIIDEIVAGMRNPRSVERRIDRREAIEFAARTAAPGDVVLVAGKGHETYQIHGTEKVPFDDREEVKRAFSNRGRTSVSPG